MVTFSKTNDGYHYYHSCHPQVQSSSWKSLQYVPFRIGKPKSKTGENDHQFVRMQVSIEAIPASFSLEMSQTLTDLTSLSLPLSS